MHANEVDSGVEYNSPATPGQDDPEQRDPGRAVEACRCSRGLCQTGSSRDLAVVLDQVLGLDWTLSSRVTLEQAKGVLMMRFGIDQDAAFRFLRRVSSARAVNVHHVSRTVIAIAHRDQEAVDQDPVLAQMLLTALE